MADSKSLLPDPIQAISPHHFTRARKASTSGRTLPQAIAHRGYKAAFPENTMAAFRGAVEVGTHAIETDLHLSSDGVVVLSHDVDLKRCFGDERKIIDCDWATLQELRTLRKPEELMPRLRDLLEYLAASPALDHIWVLFDIKIHDDPDDMIRLVTETLADVKPSPSRPWKERIVLGCWTDRYVALCTKHLPGYPITYIGWNIPDARAFLKTPNISFNMPNLVMAGPGGNAFLRDCRRHNRQVYIWTVNTVQWMQWSISKNVDGVVSDDPKLFLEVCKSFSDTQSPPLFTWKQRSGFLIVRLLAGILRIILHSWFGPRVKLTKPMAQRLIKFQRRGFGKGHVDGSSKSFLTTAAERSRDG